MSLNDRADAALRACGGLALVAAALVALYVGQYFVFGSNPPRWVALVSIGVACGGVALFQSTRGRRPAAVQMVAAFVLAGAVAAGVFYAVARPPPIAELAMKRVERPVFAVSVPASGDVLVDNSSPAEGRYVLKYEGVRRFVVTVYWEAVGLSAEDFPLVRDTVVGLGEVVSEETSDFAGGSRLFLVLDMDDGSSMVVTASVCKETSVLVSLNSLMSSRDDNVALHRRMLDSFECRGDAPVVATEIMVPEFHASRFGYLEGTNPLMMVRDDERVFLGVRSFPVLQSGTKMHRERPEAIPGMFSAMGTVLTRSAPERISAPAGDMWVYGLTVKEAESGDVFDVTLAVFDCPQQGRTFMAIYSAEQGTVKETEARTVLESFGCPSTPPRWISDLPTACDVGITSACRAPD